MKYVISRYNQDIDWLKDYSDDVVIYDRSEQPVEGAIKSPNIGSDLYDKFTFIIDNYDNLPDIAVYTKANLFKYITPEEFDLVKDTTKFTPLLTQNHKTYMPVCFYKNGMYYEINNRWYLAAHPARTDILGQLGLRDLDYLAFAPGSNYIVPKENILKHSKKFYEKLRSTLEWSVYPGEAQMLERSLYYLWL
jgi:hypothetical protein